MDKAMNKDKRVYDIVLTEEDFYPAMDDRVHDCGIDDIEGGDSYDDYVQWFWECYEDEIF